MKLPQGDRAIVDIGKIRDYVFNPEHPWGRHKAAVFQAALGWSAAETEKLNQVLKEAARTHEVEAGIRDEFGTRYTLDFAIHEGNATAVVRSAWIVLAGEEVPHLVTCFVTNWSVK